MSSDSPQFALFQDAIAQRLLRYPELSGGESSTSGSELDEFASYLAKEAWPILPDSLKTATYEGKESVPDVDTVSLDATSPAFVDTLISYGIAPDEEDAIKFLRKTLSDYVEEACAPPPVWSSTRTAECEICQREVGLTYHHLIPRSTHAKVLKRRWHHESMLNSVAWLCRQCHSAVHRVESNEVLAKEYYTVELLLQREDIQRWAQYASKQRWSPRVRRR